MSLIFFCFFIPYFFVVVVVVVALILFFTMDRWMDKWIIFDGEEEEIFLGFFLLKYDDDDIECGNSVSCQFQMMLMMMMM